MTTDDELAALNKKVEQQERELAELKAKLDPPKSTFVPKTDAEWRDEMHQLAEKRMSLATPPSVVRDWAVIPEDIVKGIREDRHAPTSATGMIPSSQTPSDARPAAGGGKGWLEPTRIDVPGGARTQELIERAVNATLPHGPEWGKGKG